MGQHPLSRAASFLRGCHILNELLSVALALQAIKWLGYGLVFDIYTIILLTWGCLDAID